MASDHSIVGRGRGMSIPSASFPRRAALRLGPAHCPKGNKPPSITHGILLRCNGTPQRHIAEKCTCLLVTHGISIPLLISPLGGASFTFNIIWSFFFRVSYSLPPRRGGGLLSPKNFLLLRRQRQWDFPSKIRRLWPPTKANQSPLKSCSITRGRGAIGSEQRAGCSIGCCNTRVTKFD